MNFVHADTCLEQQVKQFWELEGGHLLSDDKAMSVNDNWGSNVGMSHRD